LKGRALKGDGVIGLGRGGAVCILLCLILLRIPGGFANIYACSNIKELGGKLDESEIFE
jgi:hypothetical protein